MATPSLALAGELATLDVEAPDLRGRVALLVAKARAVVAESRCVPVPPHALLAPPPPVAVPPPAPPAPKPPKARGRKAAGPAPVRDPVSGKFKCDACPALFDTSGALSGHRRFCDGGKWRCAWCECTALEAGGKNPGPGGAATLCGPCGGRYRGGATGPPKRDAEGKYLCDHCGRPHDSLGSLASHSRRCDGGSWRCDWCKSTDVKGKNPGPRGPATLCGPCGGRYRSGADGPALKDAATGKYRCAHCPALFDSIGALSGHRRFCDAGSWRCDWCECTALEAGGKNPGPRGAATLCGPCGGRYRGGATGPPTKTADGKYLCDHCGRSHDTLGSLASHARRCDGGHWRCDWCKITDVKGKNPGPRGPATLCGPCGSRYRGGATGPPTVDAAGKFVCDACGQKYDTLAGLSGHARFCVGGVVDDAGADADVCPLGLWLAPAAGDGGATAVLPETVVSLGDAAPDVVGAALSTWDFATYVCARIDGDPKPWSGDDVDAALAGEAYVWLGAGDAVAKAVGARGASWPSYEADLTERGGRPRGALHRLHGTLVALIVGDVADAPALPRTAHGFRATKAGGAAGKRKREDDEPAIAPLQASADAAAVRVADAVELLREAQGSGWYAIFVAFARCVLARRLHDAASMRLERGVDESAELSDDLWPLDGAAARDAAAYAALWKRRREHDHKDPSRHEIGEAAADEAACAACEAALACAGVDTGGGGGAPYEALGVADRVGVGAALRDVALLTAAARTDGSRAVDALRRLGGARRAEAETPREPRRPPGALLAVFGGEPRATKRVALALGGSRVARHVVDDDSDDEADDALNGKYAALRCAVGSFRRSPLGGDGAGRTYWVLGERWDRVFVEPERRSGDPWREVAAPADLDALLASLGDGALKRVLGRVEGKLRGAMCADPMACTLCGTVPDGGQLLLCDGAGDGEPCAQEWCLACAGVADVPDGDWFCAKHKPRPREKEI
ncbi:hypothetical protein AURANDRAFT_66332 [Aureococcus anophagefferens]|uniref:WHIM2 domain-containing protein n=1 Tax=Aureococcus anophagefferens TaxID=44056 RepID=F0YGZ2_AURAN|nr:hypothetical protein AURANDRAFT_66332 [Aureococcus anophagefferens]EGB05573.1 hypothetical protein AURANDRAFT_66332 [Aureococcus anophagefferens]|eukprot:XP_009039704.1 hypothetical protein AURANDRAFT_66332 [Aureococcus anophagefferens]